MSGIRLYVFVAALTCHVISGEVLYAQNPPVPAAKPPELSAEAKIEAALSGKVSVDVTDQPLNEVVKSLANQAQITFVITRKIEDAGVLRDQPVTMTLKNVSLRSVLRNLLGNLNLTYMIKDEVLKITTVEDVVSPENVLMRVYPVKDLVATGKKSPNGESELRFNALEDFVQLGIEPDAWSDVGGAGSAMGFHNSASLVVSNRRDIHERVSSLLAALREVKAAQTPESRKALPVSVPVLQDVDLEVQRRIETALAKTVSYEFKDAPLKEVCAKISDDVGLPILLTKKIEDAGVEPNQPVSIKVEKISLRSFLRLLLGDLNLTYYVKDEVLKITTVEDAQAPESMVVRLFPVRDLVEWPAKEAGGRAEFAADELSNLITSCVEPDSWPDNLQVLPSDENTGTLLISQREAVHEQIADLLTQLRKAKSAQGLDRPAEATTKPVPPPVIPPAIIPPKR